MQGYTDVPPVTLPYAPSYVTSQNHSNMGP